MARLGTNQNPAWVRVHSMEKAEAVVNYCNERGWKIITAVDPDEPQDISDLEKLMLQGPTQSHPHQPKIGRNELCPCGSGKKYKKCCYP